jgi:hypothetical protein
LNFLRGQQAVIVPVRSGVVSAGSQREDVLITCALVGGRPSRGKRAHVVDEGDGGQARRLKNDPAASPGTKFERR